MAISFLFQIDDSVSINTIPRAVKGASDLCDIGDSGSELESNVAYQSQENHEYHIDPKYSDTLVSLLYFSYSLNKTILLTILLGLSARLW